jgi:hypothetical protein
MASHRFSRLSRTSAATLPAFAWWGIAVMTGVAAANLGTGLAVAQPISPETSLLLAQNQSDVTGTNVGDPPAPIVPGQITVIDQATVDEAQQIANEIDDAYADCIASQEALRNAPRRFALGPGPDICTTPECEYLNLLLEEARIFLDSLTAAEREALAESYSLQLW